MKAPSVSLVVSGVALFVALSGTAVAAKQALAPANTVGTQAIVNGSIRMTDIAPSTVKLLRGQTGAVGLTGAPGGQGPAGASGPAGGFDPTKVQVVQGSDATVGSTIGSSTASCPSGTVVVGGGGFTSGPSLWLSRPSGNGWVAGSTGYASGVSSTVRAYAVCAAP